MKPVPALLLVGLCLSSGCERRTDYQDQFVRVERSSPPAFFVHASDSVVLITKGKKYPNINGGFPYYLEVPNRRAILFVTGLHGKTPAIHLVDMVSGEHVPFFVNEPTNFGSSMARGGGPDVPFSDYIASSDNLTIVAVGQTKDFRDVITLDLVKKNVGRIEHFYLDKVAGWKLDFPAKPL